MRDNPLAWFVMFLAMVAVIAWLSIGQARAQVDGCYLLWDISIVARGMAEEGIPQATIAGAMARMYSTPRPLLEAVAKVATESKLPAAVFAYRMRQQCNGSPDPKPGTPPRAS